VRDGGIRDRPNDIDVAVNQAQMTLIGFRLRRAVDCYTNEWLAILASAKHGPD
jgi:hypothetical protein